MPALSPAAAGALGAPPSAHRAVRTMTPGPGPSPDSADLMLVHRREDVDRAVRTVLDALTRHGYSESSRFAVRLAIEEALSNAFKHGHKGLPDTTPVRFSYAAGPAQLRLVVQDQGPGFDPQAVPDPTLDENLEMPSGRGLMLIRAYMTSVEFNESGNRLTMTYTKPPAKA